MTALIDTNELFDMLDDPKVKILDATYPAASAKLEVIPGAHFFDIDLIADPNHHLPHTAPTPEEFQRQVRALGINSDDIIVVYDQKNIAVAAARAWWMFRLYGHTNVRVLNGGMKKWIQDGYDVMPYREIEIEEGNFTSNYTPELLAHTQDVLKSVDNEDLQVVDARNAERFHEIQGHIPSSKNAFFVELINQDTGELKDKEELQAVFDKGHVDMSKPTITSCGSGVTACALALALFELGKTDVAVYDGSWTEWSGHAHTPKAKAEAS